MRAYLDDAPLQCERDTLRAAFDAALTRAHEAGRLVVDVLADGQPVTQDVLRDPPDDPTESEIRFVTADPADMVVRVLREASDAARQVGVEQVEVAEHLHGGRHDEARESLERVVLIWQAITQAVARASDLLGMRLADEDLGDGVTLESALNSLKGDLQAVISTLSSEDWSGLADAVEYDLADHAKRWEELLMSAAQRVERAG